MRVIRPPPLLASLALAAACAAPPRNAEGLQQLVINDLDTAADLAGFVFTDPKRWHRGFDDQRGHCLELVEGSTYQAVHRSPLGLAVLRTPAVGDFTLEVEARQTGREYPHRDLCVVFGFRDADHFAYAHLASAADANAHQIMLVDGADRRPVTTTRTEGVAWGNGWHRLRLERRGTTVQVWFDDAVTPVLTGEVPAWPGCIGLGSFDDPGRFRALRLFGQPSGTDLQRDAFTGRKR